MGYLGLRFALSLALCWILVATIVTPVRAKALLSQQPGKNRAENSHPIHFACKTDLADMKQACQVKGVLRRI